MLIKNRTYFTNQFIAMLKEIEGSDHIHIHVGPGHHDKILLSELKKHSIKFTCTSYYPKYQFGYNDNIKFSPAEQTSSIYNTIAFFTWAATGRINFLKKKNLHYDILYPLYDIITANRLNENCKLFWGWPQVSLSCLRKVKSKGGVTILDYPIPHILTWASLLHEEARLLGEDVAHSQFSNFSIKRMLKEIEEADFISVPSQFVMQSFIQNGVSEKKLIFNPYGIDISLFHEKNFEPRLSTFKIIFVGSIEIRKGVHYLLEAFTQLNLPDCELHLIGHVHEDFKRSTEKYSSNKKIVFRGQLPKSNVAHEMRSANIMVMPSLLEGLSLTILEAMACGTPVISSLNAGGVDVIKDGENGFLFPIRDVEVLKQKIAYCYSNQRELIMIGQKAASAVRNNFTMSHYGIRIVSSLDNVL